MLELIANIASQAGGFMVAAVFALAVWKLVSRNNSANSAEASVYKLMKEEVERLSAALVQADLQLKQLRISCEAEHIKRDKEILELRHEIMLLKGNRGN